MKNREERLCSIRSRAAAMTASRRKHRILGGTLALSMAALITVCLVLPVFSGGRLRFDTQLGSLSQERAYNAQYLPDPKKLAGSVQSHGIRLLSAAEPSAKDSVAPLNYYNCDYIVENLGRLESIASGKYGGYTVQEIKQEIVGVLGMAPAFDRWFRLPYYKELPSRFRELGNWAYRFSYDRVTEKLTVLRVCWTTRASKYDAEQDRLIEDYDSQCDESVVQFNVMQTDYYHDAEGNEVVECQMYDVMVDHAKRAKRASVFELWKYPNTTLTRFNDNPDDQYPIMYQYLKNVRDKSLTKCLIKVRDRMGTYPYSENGNLYSDDGYDMTSNLPYGCERRFVQVDYDEDSVSLLQVDQVFQTAFESRPDITNVVYYGQTPENTDYYYSIYDTFDEEHAQKYLECNQKNMGIKSVDDIKFLLFEPRRSILFNSYLCEECDSAESGPRVIKTCDHYASAGRITRGNRLHFGSDSLEGVLERVKAGIGAQAYRVGVPQDSIDAYLESGQFPASAEEQSFVYEAAFNAFLDGIAVQVADHFPLRLNWLDVFAESRFAVRVKAEDLFPGKEK